MRKLFLVAGVLIAGMASESKACDLFGLFKGRSTCATGRGLFRPCQSSCSMQQGCSNGFQSSQCVVPSNVVPVQAFSPYSTQAVITQVQSCPNGQCGAPGRVIQAGYLPR